MYFRRIFAIILILLAFTYEGNALYAQETKAEYGAEKKNEKTSNNEAWNFVVVPHASYVGMNGTIGYGHKSGHVDLSPSDFASSARAGAALAVGATKGNHSIGLSASYVKLVDDAILDSSPTTLADFTLELTTVEASYGYRFFQRPRFSLDATGGLRYWNVLVKAETVDLASGAAPRYSGVMHWVDPFLGLKAAVRLTDRLSLPMAADIGGFSMGSQITSKGRIGLGYLLTRNFALEAGYGYTYVDYRKGGAIFDVTLSGPYIALGIMF